MKRWFLFLILIVLVALTLAACAPPVSPGVGTSDLKQYETVIDGKKVVLTEYRLCLAESVGVATGAPMITVECYMTDSWAIPDYTFLSTSLRRIK